MSVEPISLNAEARETGSKSRARSVRREGRIPGVVYGNGVEGVSVSVDPKELEVALRTEYGFNKVIALEVNGKTHRCMVREYQFDSVRRVMTHVDFLVIDDDQEVVVEVPVATTGKSEGVAMGGRLDIVSRAVKVRCKVKDIPSIIEHDVTKLQISEQVYIDEINEPEGCSFEFNHRFPVIRIARKRGARVGQAAEETTEAAAEAEA